MKAPYPPPPTPPKGPYELWQVLELLLTLESTRPSWRLFGFFRVTGSGEPEKLTPQMGVSENRGP